MTTEETTPDWRQDLVDLAKVIQAIGIPKAQQANQAVRGAASSAHGTAGTFVRWIIVFVALTPFVFAGFALPSPEFARAVVPGVTLVALIVTVLLFAFRWNQLVTGLVELGIITTLISKVKKPQALGSLAGAVKDFGTATLRWTSKVIGLELLIGIYFSLVPVANERVLVLVVLMLMAATIFLTLGKAKWLAWIPIILLYVATVVFFNGGIDESIRKYEAAQTTSAEEVAVSYASQTIDIIELLGDAECSESIDLSEGPRGYNYFSGPPGTQVRELSTGVVGFITETFDSIGGPVCFTGPAGEEVTVRQVPF